MYICSVLLYRCYLSVYSPFLLIVDVHSVSCVFDACVCGEVGLKPCASCVLTRMSVSLLQITWTTRQSNVQKRALWVTDLPHHHQQLGIITQSHWSQLSFHSGSVRSTRLWYKRVGTSSTACSLLCLETKRKKPRFDSSHQLTRHRLNLWHLSARTASFTTQKPSQYQRRLFAINVHCKKNNNKFFTCILYFAPLSISTPVLNFPSRFLKLFEICNMLDRPGSSGFLCFIIYNLVGLWVYIWRRNEPPRCPVLFVCEMGWTATQSVRCWSEPVVTNHCCNPDSSETFFLLFVQPSVSLLSNLFGPFFEYRRKSASLLSSAVIWCFYTLDMNLTQLLSLSF